MSLKAPPQQHADYDGKRQPKNRKPLKIDTASDSNHHLSTQICKAHPVFPIIIYEMLQALWPWMRKIGDNRIEIITVWNIHRKQHKSYRRHNERQCREYTAAQNLPFNILRQRQPNNKHSHRSRDCGNSRRND